MECGQQIENCVLPPEPAVDCSRSYSMTQLTAPYWETGAMIMMSSAETTRANSGYEMSPSPSASMKSNRVWKTSSRMETPTCERTDATISLPVPSPARLIGHTLAHSQRVRTCLGRGGAHGM